MKSYKLAELSRTEVDSLKSRPRIDFSSIFNVVRLDASAAVFLAEIYCLSSRLIKGSR